MIKRSVASVAALGGILIAASALAQHTPSAQQRMGELGPENAALGQQVGTWDVTETAWDTPGAPPTVTRGLVAERKMVGSSLQETLHPALGSAGADVLRIDYLSFNRVEGRWKYVSMDTRAPVGLMPAASISRNVNGAIVLLFEPFATTGPGAKVTGQMLRMDEVITRQGPDRDLKQQHFMLADGDGVPWLAHQYAYVRRP